MTPRFRPTFRPDLLELERRDVPAWFSVTAPSLLIGAPLGTSAHRNAHYEGDTSYSPGRGTVLESGVSPIDAARKALNGTVTLPIEGADGTVRTQTFPLNRDTVGVSPDEHKRFLLVQERDGTEVLELEADAGDAGSDYTYDDGSWDGITALYAPGEVVSSDEFTWVGREGGVTVTITVTVNADGTYNWDYQVRNDSFQNAAGEGLTGFSIPLDDSSIVQTVGSTIPGVTGYADDGFNNGGQGNVTWSFGGNGLGTGQEGDLSFTTPPAEEVPTGGTLLGPDGQPVGDGPAVSPGALLATPEAAPEPAPEPAPNAALLTTKTVLTIPSVTWVDGIRVPTAYQLVATVQAVVPKGAPAPASPTGDVEFLDGTTSLGTATLVAGPNGVSTATLTIGELSITKEAACTDAPGLIPLNFTKPPHSLTAKYEGDAANNASTSAATRLDLTTALAGTKPLSATPPRTPASLTWADYPVRNVAANGAETRTTPGSAETHEIDNLIITGNKLVSVQCRMGIVTANFRSDFDGVNSYVFVNAPRTKALLDHERLHLAIDQLIAESAGLNRRGMRSQAFSMGSAEPKPVAVGVPAVPTPLEDATTRAKKELFDKWNGYITKWGSVQLSCDNTYDVVTGHGANPGPQKDWEDNVAARVYTNNVANGWPN